MGEACSTNSDCNQHHSECSGVCNCVDGYEYDQFALECYPGELFTYYYPFLRWAAFSYLKTHVNELQQQGDL